MSLDTQTPTQFCSDLLGLEMHVELCQQISLKQLKCGPCQMGDFP